jgi:hypothetical protein
MKNKTFIDNQNTLEDRKPTQLIKTGTRLTIVVSVQCFGYVILHSSQVFFVKQFKNAFWIVAIFLSLLNSCPISWRLNFPRITRCKIGVITFLSFNGCISLHVVSFMSSAGDFAYISPKSFPFPFPLPLSCFFDF